MNRDFFFDSATKHYKYQEYNYQFPKQLDLTFLACDGFKQNECSRCFKLNYLISTFLGPITSTTGFPPRPTSQAEKVTTCTQAVILLV